MKLRHFFGILPSLVACGDRIPSQTVEISAKAIVPEPVPAVPHHHGLPSVENSPSLSLQRDESGKSAPVVDKFNLPELDPARTERSETLWATWYNLYQGKDIGGTQDSFALRDLSGIRLGPMLSLKDWCYSAMEGSAIIKRQDGTMATYNYAGTSTGHPISCSKYFPNDVSRTKFHLANGAFGDGVNDYKLAPFRTIAVDSNQNIPYGTVLYIAAARGTALTLPNGTTAKHDGYFFAGDTGGAIKGNHIDVFLGFAKVNPFIWVKSRASATVRAAVVEDAEIAKFMRSLHQ